MRGRFPGRPRFYYFNQRGIYMAFVEVSEGRIHYLDEGNGPPLFLLHENPGSGQVWRKVTPEIRLNHRVIAHDRRGFGRSPETHGGEFGPRAYAGELARLMDALDIERANVCGLSFGGMVAQYFALDFPDRVGAVILTGTTADRTGRNVADKLAEMQMDDWAVVSERLVRSWFRDESDPADIAEACEIALQSSQRMRELTVTALGVFDIKSDLGLISAPTLIIVGEQDVTFPLHHSEIMRDEIPDARLVQIPNCGHLVPVEQPGAFCQHVIAFLDDVAAA